MKRVLLDCDGVLADFIGPVLDLVAEVTGRRHKREDVAAFEFASQLQLTADEKRAVTHEISHRDGWWQRLPVFPGAAEGVERLQSIAEVYVVTSPWNSCRTWLHDREAWLKKHFGIPHRNVIACGVKHVVAGHMLVDDRSDTLTTWARHNPNGYAVQWQTPHNRAEEWSGLSTHDWGQLVRWVGGEP